MLKRHYYFAPGVIERQARSSPLRSAVLALARLALLAGALGLLGLIAGLFVGWASP